MVGAHHKEMLRILGQNAPLWWLAKVWMCKNNGFPGQTAPAKKEGVYPPPKNAKTPGKPHFTMVLTPSNDADFC